MGRFQEAKQMFLDGFPFLQVEQAFKDGGEGSGARSMEYGAIGNLLDVYYYRRNRCIDAGNRRCACFCVMGKCTLQ